jgi:3-hydroxybutyryl-CoA dehydratase
MNEHASYPSHPADEAPTASGRANLATHSSPGGEEMRWSDPFDRLSVGQRFRTGQRTVSETDVMVFSALTSDWHPQHCDPDWAARSSFGERIAHGMLTLSLAVGLVPLDPELVLALRRVGDVVFKRPVRLNESIRVEGEIAALTPLDEQAGLVNLGWAIRNQGDALVCRARVEVLWRRAGAPGEEVVETFWHDEITAGARPQEFVPVPL